MSVTEIQKYRKILTEGNETSPINQSSEKEQIEAVTHRSWKINFITNPSEAVQLAAVRKSGPAIRYIKDPTKTVIITALLSMIKKDDNVLKGYYKKYRELYPNWPEWSVIDKAINGNNEVTESYGITPAQRQNLSNASEQEQLAAVTHDWKNIRYIKTPSEAVQLAAVNEHPVALTDIAEPTHAAKLAAVKEFGSSVRFIRGKAEKDVVITAALTMIKNQEPAYEDIIKELEEEYPEFPEWPIINKALSTAKKELNEGVDLNTASEEEQIAAVSSSYSAIEQIKNPSEAVQIAAVEFYPLNIKYIWKPCVAAQLVAVKQDPTALLKINNLASKQVVITSMLGYIKLHGSNFLGSPVYNKFREKYPNWPEWEIIEKSLRSVGNVLQESDLNTASEEEQLKAVTRSARNLSQISNPSEAVQLAVMSQPMGGSYLKYIKNPSEAVQLAAIETWPHSIAVIDNPSEEVQLAAVTKIGYTIGKIKNPSEEVQLAAVDRHGEAIGEIEEPSERVQLAAIDRDPSSLTYINNPTEEVQLYGIKKAPWLISRIRKPSEAVQLAAVKAAPYVLKMIQVPASKNVIVTGILAGIKKDDIEMETVNKFKRKYPDWPEWTIINKAISSLISTES